MFNQPCYNVSNYQREDITMQFTLPDLKNDKKKLHFMRTLKTEKDFKDRYDVEFNAQLGTVLSVMMDVDKNPNKQNIEALTDLKFSETRNKLVAFMYAKRNEDGVLYQNRNTIDEAERLIRDGHISPNAVLVQLLKSI